MNTVGIMKNCIADTASQQSFISHNQKMMLVKPAIPVHAFKKVLLPPLGIAIDRPDRDPAYSTLSGHADCRASLWRSSLPR